MKHAQFQATNYLLGSFQHLLGPYVSQFVFVPEYCQFDISENK